MVDISYLEGDHLHPLEGVGGLVQLLVAERHEEAVGDELDVLRHERGVHANELDGQGLCHELLLDLERLRDQLVHGRLRLNK